MPAWPASGVLNDNRLAVEFPCTGTQASCYQGRGWHHISLAAREDAYHRLPCGSMDALTITAENLLNY
jgi:hypothetical protein